MLWALTTISTVQIASGTAKENRQNLTIRPADTMPYFSPKRRDVRLL